MTRVAFVAVVLAILNAIGVPLVDWGTIDGHPHCMTIVADTSVSLCADGYVTTS